jgi:hypothetical protein
LTSSSLSSSRQPWTSPGKRKRTNERAKSDCVARASLRLKRDARDAQGHNAGSPDRNQQQPGTRGTTRRRQSVVSKRRMDSPTKIWRLAIGEEDESRSADLDHAKRLRALGSLRFTEPKNSGRTTDPLTLIATRFNCSILLNAGVKVSEPVSTGIVISPHRLVCAAHGVPGFTSRVYSHAATLWCMWKDKRAATSCPSWRAATACTNMHANAAHPVQFHNYSTSWTEWTTQARTQATTQRSSGHTRNETRRRSRIGLAHRHGDARAGETTD